ncbi:hypothetical protein GO003_021160 [Methylicorpusculum oleiharenae]|uniref:hypothetical protein n=1 Tax=Methylicorpusculum oleiharenae TaxID=1338687 RepID=UPI00135A250B|nr:hypothetical protein [Methylicorpusculum oleiharenae]MCD2452895.1 hypothetical protein [Methylicorpusculum oleiharenae]
MIFGEGIEPHLLIFGFTGFSLNRPRQYSLMNLMHSFFLSRRYVVIEKTGLTKFTRALCLSAVLPFVAPEVSAALIATIDGYVGANYSYRPYLSPILSGGDTVPFNQPLTNNASSSFAYATPFGAAADVVARVGDGWMRFGAVGSSATFAVPARDEAGGHAFFGMRANVLDTIVINNPSLTGTIGFADLGFLAEGVLSAGRDAPANNNSRALGSADISITLFAINTVTQNFRLDAENRGFQQDIPAVGLQNELMGGELSFVFGTPFNYSVVLETYGSATSSSVGGLTTPGLPAATSFVSDFRNTITWAGVSSLRDAAGNPVTDFTAFSGTGADFRNAIVPTSPIPLPGGFLLFGSALTVMYAGRFKAYKV